jgi:nucleoid DNA-binding protein
MPKTYYNRAQIVKKIAPQVDLTQSQTDKIIREIEAQVLSLGKERGRVIIAGFGSFKFYKRKSTTIKQIKTKKKRLIISQMVVKFISTDTFKKKIKETSQPKDTTQTKKLSSYTPQKTKKISESQPQAPKPQTKILLKPLSYYEPVSKDRFYQILQERLGKSTRQNDWLQSGKKYIEDTPEGQLILYILKLAQNRNCNKVNFIFENNIVYIFYNKPRELIGKLSNDLCQRFFANHFDLTELDIPQERTKLFELKNKNHGIIIMNVHFLPTKQGASIMVQFKTK